MELISVILPVYNGEKTISLTIDSVLNQTFNDFELIIIDDGSQDLTLKIIKQIADPRVQYFSYSNAGVSASRNRGVSQAFGEYISFIDADDLWTPDKLEAQLKALLENPQAAVAYSWTTWIDEKGELLQGAGRGVYCTINGNVYEKLLLSDFIAGGSNALIRKQAFIEVGGFDQSLTHAEDWDLWLRLAAHYHFVAVPAAQIFYRQSENSASVNVWRMEEGSLQTIKKAFSTVPDSLKYLKRFSLANRYKYLTFKAMDGSPAPMKGIAATKFFCQAIRYDPGRLPQRRNFCKLWFKITIMVLLPPKLAEAFISKFESLPKLQGALFQSLRFD